jgi:hypothetical protein
VGGTCGTHEEREVYRVLMGKQEGKRPLERPTHRWVDVIRMDLRESGWGSVEWTQLAQDWDRCRVLAPRNLLPERKMFGEKK